LPRLFPAVAALPLEKQQQFADQTVALLHHVVAAPWSLARLADEWRQQREKGPAGHIDYRPNEKIVGFTCAYFLADFFNALRDIKASPDFVFHHLAGLLVISGLRAGPAMRWIPHIMAAESSTLFLTALWYMRQLGKTGTPAYTAAGVGFVAVFTATRILHMPAVLASLLLRHRVDFATLGWTGWLLPPVQVLQFYWYAKILRQFAPVIKALVKG
jgi:hypothetical protein